MKAGKEVTTLRDIYVTEHSKLERITSKRNRMFNDWNCVWGCSRSLSRLPALVSSDKS